MRGNGGNDDGLAKGEGFFGRRLVFGRDGDNFSVSW